MLKPLAVASAKRLPALPQVPTFTEAGTPMIASAWYGLMLPANAPAEVLGGSAADFAKFTLSEINRYEAIVKDSGAPKE